MSKDDPRMHGHNTPGMVGGRGHERHEEPVRLNHEEPGDQHVDQPRADATAAMRDRHQPSALGGETATRSGTAQTPPDDLERNPGIGASEGAFAATDVDPEAIEGLNTFEGDVENQATPDGAAQEGKLGRTNK